jgi:hypothetical protein
MMSEDINFGAITEALNDKADRDLNNMTANIDYVVESYDDGTNWYRVYKSGWLEMGGYVFCTIGAASGNVVTFLKPFINTKYTIVTTCVDRVDANAGANYKTETSFATAVSLPGDSWLNNLAVNWYACGQGA